MNIHNLPNATKGILNYKSWKLRLKLDIPQTHNSLSKLLLIYTFLTYLIDTLQPHPNL